MNATFDNDELALYKVSLPESFTFEIHEEFKKTIKAIENKHISGVVIDLSAVSFIDSAGLGMLLLAKELAEDKNISITLSRPKNEVVKVFKATCFDSLFNIEY